MLIEETKLLCQTFIWNVESTKADWKYGIGEELFALEACQWGVQASNIRWYSHFITLLYLYLHSLGCSKISIGCYLKIIDKICGLIRKDSFSDMSFK